MIAAQQPHSDLFEDAGPRRVVVPVWLRVPAHADIGDVADEDLAAECRRRGYAVFRVGADLVLPGVVVRTDRHALVWGRREIAFTAREGEVVRVLAAAWPRGVRKETLLQEVWGGHVAPHTVSVYVRYLRRKAPGLIETLRHYAGYRLCLEVPGD